MKRKHRFEIGDDVISNYDYAWIPRGTKMKVAGITSSGALKLCGIQGTYKSEKFLTIDEYNRRNNKMESDKEYNTSETYYQVVGIHVRASRNVYAHMDPNENHSNIPNYTFKSDRNVTSNDYNGDPFHPHAKLTKNQAMAIYYLHQLNLDSGASSWVKNVEVVKVETKIRPRETVVITSVVL